ncbi:hypothetical protein E8E14_008244 [Neopestalotiopsis sp. 37M]|nr:hypothetical protein E8E14_008244 [Neopestalotiopsis sp. 37M]
MRAGVLGTALCALGALGAPSAPRSVRRLSQRDQKAFSFPLPDGFPNIDGNSSALQAIQAQAHGTLPNGPLPSSITDVSAIIWSLIAFNELFEVAYFSSLINNITDKVHGYEVGSTAASGVVLNALQTVRAQEELHALGANGILKAAGRHTISPCEYVFPVDNFEDAIAFASTFTDVVLGTLQEAQTNFGLDGDVEFIGLVGSVIGQEGEQNGFYRSIGQPSKVPSAQPFLTAASGVFALSALHQLVVVPGSCPDTIPIPILDALNVDTDKISPQTTEIQFSFYTNDTKLDTDSLSLVYINGQNLPLVEKLSGVSNHNGMVQFSAPFPYQQFQMDGLTLAAVTKSSGPFANASDVAGNALFGPGIIEVD